MTYSSPESPRSLSVLVCRGYCCGTEAKRPEPGPRPWAGQFEEDEPDMDLRKMDGPVDSDVAAYAFCLR